MPLPIRVTPFVGVYGVSFLFAMTAATVALLILRRSRRQLYWLAVVPALLLLPELPVPEPPTEMALVVQPNMPEVEEWTYAAATEVRDHLIAVSLKGPSFPCPPDRMARGSWPHLLLPRS